MARQELRDGFGRLVGWRQNIGSRVEGRDYGGRLRGWYDPKFNETRDATGRVVGRGDLLSAVIMSP